MRRAATVGPAGPKAAPAPVRMSARASPLALRGARPGHAMRRRAAGLAAGTGAARPSGYDDPDGRRRGEQRPDRRSEQRPDRHGEQRPDRRKRAAGPPKAEQCPDREQAMGPGSLQGRGPAAPGPEGRRLRERRGRGPGERPAGPRPGARPMTGPGRGGLARAPTDDRWPDVPAGITADQLDPEAPRN